ncbi:MAG: hypothetical protein LBM05_00650 [Endomicrobium sp.]|jgi:hypothetical protein|nr:hypothetical protein [Endomicrobium sp.]
MTDNQLKVYKLIQYLTKSPTVEVGDYNIDGIEQLIKEIASPDDNETITRHYIMNLGPATEYHSKPLNIPAGYTFESFSWRCTNNIETLPLPIVALNPEEQTSVWYTDEDKVFHVMCGTDRTDYSILGTVVYKKGNIIYENINS